MIEILEEDLVDLGRKKTNENFTAIQTHLDSQENPHVVTAVQVGAVPVASWGTVWAEGVDLNTVLSPGVHAARQTPLRRRAAAYRTATQHPDKHSS